MKQNRKPRNYVARDLLTSGLYGMRVVRSKKAYVRKQKHKDNDDTRFELYDKADNQSMSY
jgi:hypothetical protein